MYVFVTANKNVFFFITLLKKNRGNIYTEKNEAINNLSQDEFVNIHTFKYINLFNVYFKI